MRFAAPVARFVDRLNGVVPDRILHFELIKALYGATSTPKALFIATAAAVTITAIAWQLSADGNYLAFALGFLMIGLARSAAAYLFHRTEHDPNDLAAIRLWEYAAMLGAWAFSGLVGIIGAYALTVHPSTDVEILIACGVIGYVAGVSSRNASRPLVTIGQISATCLPFIAALLWRADLAHLSLALFIATLYVGTIVVARSVFENLVARHQAYRHIETLAHRDTLTDLWNRSAFLALLETKFAPSQAKREEIALIALDLDRFKDINDTFGHPVGDSVLREAGDRIQSAISREDEVSRMGGDEFLIALLGKRALEVENVAEHILERFKVPFKVDTARSMCGASVGFAKASPGSTLEELLRDADLALYEAKRRGRGQIVPFTADLSLNYQNRTALENDLDIALANGEFEIAYQPIVDPRSGRTICCEALLRWNHPVIGKIKPDVFIPIAESRGLIVPIGAWVLTTACREATCWDPEIKLAVNLSPVQFKRDREILDVTTSALMDSGLACERLDLEITESVLINDSEATRNILNGLRDLGIGISLDDFGTGFASIAYLNDFPISKIKIDKRFSQNIGVSPRTSAIVRGIAQIARELHMECIAEGVETLEQLEQLHGFGINAIQGYLFSKPLPAEQLRDVIKGQLHPASSLRRSDPSVRRKIA